MDQQGGPKRIVPAQHNVPIEPVKLKYPLLDGPAPDFEDLPHGTRGPGDTFYFDLPASGVVNISQVGVYDHFSLVVSR